MSFKKIIALVIFCLWLFSPAVTLAQSCDTLSDSGLQNLCQTCINWGGNRYFDFTNNTCATALGDVSVCEPVTDITLNNRCLECISFGSTYNLESQTCNDGAATVDQLCNQINNFSLRIRCNTCIENGGTFDQSSQTCSIQPPADNNSGNNENYEPTQSTTKLPNFDFCDQIGDERLRDACENCGESGDAIFTAFGCVSTDQEGLSRDLITVLFGIAGGVALLSILAGSFLLTTSQGDTNKIKSAKELMTASVSGLLFMIFSIIVLKFIGVDILQIPGLI